MTRQEQLEARRVANRIRDAYTLTEAEGILNDYITALIQEAVNEGRVGALLDLEEWAKLHDLDSEQILGGIEHMVKSIIQVPDQRHKSHTKRIKELSGGSNNEK